MKFRLYGKISRPTVGVIGTFDPFLTKHRNLLGNLVIYGKKIGLQPLVIMLDPSPSSLIFNNEKSWAIYDSTEIRIERVSKYGINAVMIASFEKKELDLPTSFFFENLCKLSNLKELIVGASQVFGRGIYSSSEKLLEIANDFNFELFRLPSDDDLKLAGEIRENLRNGLIKDCIDIIGNPPIISKKDNKKIFWAEGDYECIPIRNSLDYNGKKAIKVKAILGETGLIFDFPKQYQWFAFLSGPGDLKSK